MVGAGKKRKDLTGQIFPKRAEKRAFLQLFSIHIDTLSMHPKRASS
jgi:hypothetical protein